MSTIFVLVLLAASIAACAAVDSAWFSACMTSGSGWRPLVLTAGRQADCLAWSTFTDSISTTGWANLIVETNPAYDDQSQAFAAGWIESALTRARIYQAYQVFSPPGTANNFTLQFAEQNVLWTRAQLASHGIPTFAFEHLFDNFADLVPENQVVPCAGLMPNASNSRPANEDEAYWRSVAVSYAQLRGMYEGYVAANPPANQTMSWMNILLIGLSIELADIQMAPGFNYTYPTSNNPSQVQVSVAPTALFNTVPVSATGSGHCSTFIKLAPNATDLFMGHTTWFTYDTMIRIYKLYKFPFSFAVNVEMQFSSYPGYMWSSDDFYQMRDQRLVVQETTQNIDYSNATIFLPVSPFNQLPAWVRTLSANRLATSGASWGQVFAKHNGGTYSNQWEVVDMKAFVVGTMPAQNSGVLTIVSQIPGEVKTFDASLILTTQTYWGGFNIPYLYEHYIALGLQNVLATTGDAENSWHNSSRYHIFARDHGKVSSADAHRRMLRYNQFQTDPLSHGSPLHAIAARQDLQQPLPVLYGALDAKTTSASLMTGTSLDQCCMAIVQSGPTSDDQTPFNWASRPSWLARKPAGQPNLFNFSWQHFNLATLVPPMPAPSGLTTGQILAVVIGVSAVLASVAWFMYRNRASLPCDSSQADAKFERLVEHDTASKAYGSVAFQNAAESPA